MISQSYHFYVERIDKAKSMARFYAMSIEPTLFGDASLTRCWGRIGARGQTKIHLFECEGDAVALFIELSGKKRRKGYVAVGNGD